MLACVLPVSRPTRAWTMLPSGPKSRIAPGFSRPAPRLRLGALVRVPPAPFLRPRRTVRGLPACCSWRQSWGSARFGTARFGAATCVMAFAPRLSPRRPVVPTLWLAPECRACRPRDLRRGAGFPGRQHVPVPRFCPAKLYSPSVAATEVRAGLLQSLFRPRGCVTAAKLRRSVARLVRLRGVHRIPCLLALRRVRRGDAYASFGSGHPGTSRLCSTAGAVPPDQHCCWKVAVAPLGLPVRSCPDRPVLAHELSAAIQFPLLPRAL